MNAEAIALDMFSKWYEFCLENGLEPEIVVENFGEMLLITNADLVEKVKNILDN
jgi:hypothetical protein